ncbi:MAG: S8 family serine peptidase [Pseudomonadota bacterium]
MRGFLSRKTVMVCVLAGLALLAGAEAVLAGQLHKPTGNMSSVLETLAASPSAPADQLKAAGTKGAYASGLNDLVIDNQNRILVYIRVDDAGEANIRALKNAGAAITHISNQYNTVTALVETGALKTISALLFVRRIDEVVKPATNQIDCAGATTSEGDVQLKADAARAKYGVDGSGVIVGVLSDSFATLTDPTSADGDIQTGDLPGAANPCGQTTPVNVIEDYGDVGYDEGRAMAQIVHDLAPGAQLAFVTANTGLFQFADNIRKLRTQAKADIIVDDVTYFAEPIFQDGPVAAAITEVVNDGALYFTSAGNSNAVDGDGNNVSSHEAAAYRPTTCPALFNGGEAFEDMGPDCHNFDPAGDTPYQQFVLADQGYFRVILSWAEPWYGVETDIDFYVTDSSNNIITYSVNTNTGSAGTQQPIEHVIYQNTSGGPITVRLYITRYEGANAPRLKYTLFRSRDILSSLFNASNSTDIFGPSIIGHSGGEEAMSIAAVPYNDASNPESFTSRGYFTVYFGPVTDTTPAEALAAPQTRLKPDVAATDGGANTFFGSEEDGVYRFYGTSAAAPHAAAVAALMVEKNRREGRPDLTKADVEKFMEGSAAAVPGGGPTITGAGLLDASAALAYMLNPAPWLPFVNTGSDSNDGLDLGCFLSDL